MSASAAEKATPPTVSVADAGQLSALAESLKRYQPAAATLERDTLEGRFHVDISHPLPEFDTLSAKAYAATDKEGSIPLLALVCHPGVVPRHTVIQKLQGSPHPSLLPIAAAGAVSLSNPQEERFVIFYTRPEWKTLAEMLAENKSSMSDEFLRTKIIAPLTKTIAHLASFGITHGSIHIDNIYWNDMPILGDCASGPCGFSQHFFYEPVERAQALSYAKGESGHPDYYAIAALVLVLLYGEEHIADLTPDTLIFSILREGTHAALTRGKNNPSSLDDFLHGVLCQHPEERWTHVEIQSWLTGKRFNVLQPPTPVSANRPFELGGASAYNAREMAHLMHLQPDQIYPILETGKLAQWVSVNLRDKELSETILRIGKNAADLPTGNDDRYNEYVMQILMLLDPEGPIRIDRLSFHPDGMASLIAELLAEKMDDDIAVISRYIDIRMIAFWANLHNVNTVVPSPDAAHTKIERLRAYLHNAGPGFGIERIFYELNPHAPCQSHLCDGSYITTLQALLLHLDRLSTSLANDCDPIDRHIAAFLASKLGIQYELRLHDLSAIPMLAMHRSIIALKLLSLAQEQVGLVRLPGLANWLALRILPTMDTIRSKTLRHTVKQKILEAAHSGSLLKLAEVVIHSGYAANDNQTFSDAWNNFQFNAAQIKKFRSGVGIDERAVQLGLVMSRFFAYAVLALSLMAVLTGR